MKEYINRLDAAQTKFDWAVTPEEVDVAIYELKAAELNVSNYVKEKKKEEEKESVQIAQI